MIKLIIGVLVIGFVSSLIFWLVVLSANSTQEEKNTAVTTTPENTCKTVIAEEVITIQDMIYQPSSLSIQRCTKVTFSNKDNVDHWPASDIHPTHGIYPEFDPKRALKPGEKWSFVFEKPGKWQYHDHLNPDIYDMIIVRP